jgi:hypothetical protein
MVTCPPIVLPDVRQRAFGRRELPFARGIGAHVELPTSLPR